MANIAVSDKFFLDKSGLQALIVKIAGLKSDLEAVDKKIQDVIPFEEFWDDDLKKPKITVKDYIDAADTAIWDVIGEGQFGDGTGEKETISVQFARLLKRFNEVIKFSDAGSTELNEILDQLVVPQATADGANNNGGESILKHIVNYIKALRDALGKWEENVINTEDFTEFDGTTVTSAVTSIVEKIDEILSDASDLEARVAKLEGGEEDVPADDKSLNVGKVVDGTAIRVTDFDHNGAFVKVAAEQDNQGQKVDVKFYNSNDKLAGGFSIDTADFIIHGMLSNVYTCVYTKAMYEMTETSDPIEGLEWFVGDVVKTKPDGQKMGHHFLVFEFNLEHLDENDPEIHDHKEHIWVDVNDLYTDYTFNVSSDEYFDFEVNRTDAQNGEGTQDYEFTLNIAKPLRDVVNAVNGGVDRDSEEARGSYSGENRMNPDPSRGVYKLDNDLLDAEDNIADLTAKQETDRACIDRIEAVIGLTHADGDKHDNYDDNYDDNYGTIIDRVSGVEAWSMECHMGEKYVIALWNWVMDPTPEEEKRPLPNPSDSDFHGVDPTEDDHWPVGPNA